MSDLHLDRLVAALLVVQRLGDHAVAAGAAEAAGAVGRQLRPVMAPQPVQRQLGRFAERVPQRDVERRHRHGGDAAAAERDGGLPQILPDRLDRAGILADDARDDHFVEAGDDGSDTRPEQEQIAHAGDAAFGLDIDHQKVAGVAEGMALEPRRLRPRHAQHGGADGRDGHVAHGRISFPVAADAAEIAARRQPRRMRVILCGSHAAVLLHKADLQRTGGAHAEDPSHLAKAPSAERSFFPRHHGRRARPLRLHLRHDRALCRRHHRRRRRYRGADAAGLRKRQGRGRSRPAAPWTTSAGSTSMCATWSTSI